MSRSRPIQPTTPRRFSQPSLASILDEHGLVLLFDGTCGLCNRAVQWILRRDPAGTMQFAPLDSALGREALTVLPDLASVDSMVLVHRKGAWIKSTAALEIARYVGGFWSGAVIGYLLPRALRDWMYDQVAQRRTAMFGRTEQCLIPEPGQRARFHLR